MKTMLRWVLGSLVILGSVNLAMAAEAPADEQAEAEKDAPLMSSQTFSGLKLRNIGPALMSGRIADIALHPDNPNIWYVGVGSGGVWKTVNSGTTWQPIFDGQSVYSIGAVTIDPNNPSRIWVGSGENVGGRHVSFGDGIYLSQDDGKSWKNLGLKESEHISKIIVHPEDSNVVWVASQGPLWNDGGDRGIYKTVDGGKTWKRVLGDDEWVGATDLVIDPRDPDRLYAATWQRHRTVAAYMGGGPGTGIHRSLDGGENWEELTSGLPQQAMGKIGLAISPQKPDILYAAIELERRTGAVYKSTNRGASWTKQSDAVSGATGPHYYQELYASPHQFDKLFLVDVRMQVSEDGGKTFTRMKEEHKHSDNHAIAFRPDDPDYLLVGTDGGLYESFDNTANWRFIDNLPLTQYYKVAVDDDVPFYNIYGGTQDNNSQGGPSRTDNVHGIRNADWFITLFGDGHQPATEPGNPDILYSEWQQGNLVRYDRTTGEIVYIQPQPEAGEPSERFNWDAPILVSPHEPTRLYFASQRVWRSDDRGDSWTAISGDLTRNQERFSLPLMDRQWSWDSPWDVLAMSKYNTITSLAESPLQEGLVYAGTDDGLFQVTEDGGENWQRYEVSRLPGVPKTAFVNDIKADLFDADTVYIALDNHKFGDYRPYLLKSTNRGRSWRSIKGDLPDNHLVWRLVQDHEDPDLLFAGTEFGLFFTGNGGTDWIKLSGGVPTISFRDLAIQRRENDLIGATFGRGFYVFDDYTALREMDKDRLEQDAFLNAPRDAWWYIPRRTLGGGKKASQGASYYTADNPPFGAVFTYYLKDTIPTLKSERQEKEKPLIKDGDDVEFPGWDALEAERRQPAPAVWLVVKDETGNVVRRVKGSTKKGFHRVAWDLRYPATAAIGTGGGFFDDEPTGMLAAPGKYSVQLVKQVDDQITPLAEAQSFQVEPMRSGKLKGKTPEQTVAFWKSIAKLQGAVSAASQSLNQSQKKLADMRVALSRTQAEPGELDARLHAVEQQLIDLNVELNGSPSRQQVGELEAPTINSRISVALLGTVFSTYGPTPTHQRSLEIAKQDFVSFSDRLNTLQNDAIPALEQALQDAGAPWTSGRPIPSP